MEDNSLSHSRYNCTYHIVFIPKYRRKAMFGALRKEVGEILNKVCKMEEVIIIKAATLPDISLFYAPVGCKTITYFMNFKDLFSRGFSWFLSFEFHGFRLNIFLSLLSFLLHLRFCPYLIFISVPLSSVYSPIPEVFSVAPLYQVIAADTATPS